MTPKPDAHTPAELKRVNRMRFINIQRCAEAMDMLYKTYVIDSAIAQDRGLAIQAINRMIIAFGGEDTISKIEAAPWSARMRDSGEQDLINLEKDMRKEIDKRNEP